MKKEKARARSRRSRARAFACFSKRKSLLWRPHNKIPGKKKRLARARDARAREPSLVFQKEKAPYGRKSIIFLDFQVQVNRFQGGNYGRKSHILLDFSCSH